MTILYTILFFIALVVAAGLVAWKVIAKRNREKRRTWIVELGLLDSLLKGIEIDMIAHGFGKANYVSPGHDCSEYAPEWLRRIEAGLSSFRPNDQTEWMKQYSFQRDPYPDGRDAGRHRVVAIKTDKGMVYIETYRIDGSLYRTLTPHEEINGYFIGD